MSSQAINYGHDPVYDWSAIIAANIRAEAVRQRHNQSTIAKALGIRPATVSLRWNGKRDWPLDDVAKVAALLGTTPWDLARPAPEYDKGQPERLASVWKLPRLDSNQQPFD